MSESFVNSRTAARNWLVYMVCEFMMFKPRVLVTIFSLLLYVFGFALVPLAVLAQPPDTVWARVYETDYIENNMVLHETQDAGFMMAGFYYVSPQIGLTQAFLRKIDRNGNEEWFRDYGGSGSQFFHDGVQTSDGGYILGGSDAHGGAWVVKTDANGDTMWTRHVTGNPSEWRAVYGIDQTEDGGYMLVGNHDDQPGINYYLIKLRPSGAIEWMRSHSNGWRTRITINDFQQTCDGGYVLVGYFLRWVPPVTPYAAYAAKVDSRGNLIWSRTYERPEGPSEAHTVDVMSNGGFSIGASVEADAGTHLYLIRIDSLGEVLWERVHDEIILYYNDLLWLPGGGYLLSATNMFRRQAVLVRLNTEGDTVWTKTFGSMPDYYFGNHICLTRDGGIGYACAIDYVSGPERLDSYLARLEPESTYPWPEAPDLFSLSQNYPNPFNNSTKFSFQLLARIRISLRVFNEIGREVVTLRDGILPCGTYHVVFDGSNLPSGVYFYRLEAGGAHKVKKMVLLK